MAETLHRASGVDEVRTRTAVPIRRTHQRFLIRKCEVFHQYSAMYCARLKALKRSAMDALLKKIVASASASTDCIPPTCRLLDLTHGQRALCVGVVYKQMRLLTRSSTSTNVSWSVSTQVETRRMEPTCARPYLLQ
ncbi:hypothetical protein ERJ75_000117700 [Trypanosoma vivax]|nr:hypothetical protein ERJ75_000117700 [Trypanosoma vivax]